MEVLELVLEVLELAPEFPELVLCFLELVLAILELVLGVLELALEVLEQLLEDCSTSQHQRFATRVVNIKSDSQLRNKVQYAPAWSKPRRGRGMGRRRGMRVPYDYRPRKPSSVNRSLQSEQVRPRHCNRLHSAVQKCTVQ